MFARGEKGRCIAERSWLIELTDKPSPNEPREFSDYKFDYIWERTYAHMCRLILLPSTSYPNYSTILTISVIIERSNYFKKKKRKFLIFYFFFQMIASRALLLLNDL